MNKYRVVYISQLNNVTSTEFVKFKKCALFIFKIGDRFLGLSKYSLILRDWYRVDTNTERIMMEQQNYVWSSDMKKYMMKVGKCYEQIQ